MPAARTGLATGMHMNMRTIGGSIGGQIAAASIAGHIVIASGLPDESGFRLGFLFAAAGMALALVAALAIAARDRAAGPATASGGIRVVMRPKSTNGGGERRRLSRS